MKSICEINDLIQSGGVGKTLIDLPAGTWVKTVGKPGAYFGAAGDIKDPPTPTGNYMYRVYVHGTADRIIIATDMYTGDFFTIHRHGNVWDQNWYEVNETDLSNYYNKTQTDAKIAAGIKTTRADVAVDGTLRVRLSGTTLYITNTGKSA